MYYTLFNLLHQYIFNLEPLNEYMELTLTLASTIGSLFVVCIPFICVYLIFKIFCGGLFR